MEAEAQSLEEMRADFSSRANTILEPVNRKYIAALRRLEKEYALEKNYEAAIAVRDERLAVEALVKAESGGETGVSPQEMTVTSAAKTEDSEFAGGDARPLDGASVDEGNLAFQAPGQSGEWDIGELVPGGYEILVTYASNGAATLQAMEHFFRLTADLPATGAVENFKTASLGTLKITSRATKISLALKSGAGMIIREVKLVSNRE